MIGPLVLGTRRVLYRSTGGSEYFVDVFHCSFPEPIDLSGSRSGNASFDGVLTCGGDSIDPSDSGAGTARLALNR
jgi:hypothetical protein